MAEEKQPTDIHEGASTPPAPTGSKEDQKTAAALSNLDTANGEDDGASKKKLDTEALSKAMQNLDVNGAAGSKKAASGEVKKAVKVNATDVSLLVTILEISKPKATELLKAHDGDAETALKAWVLADDE